MSAFRSSPDAGAASGTIRAGLSSLDPASWPELSRANAEGVHYHAAFETAAAVDGTAPQAVVVERDDRELLAAAPLFSLSYRLDTPFQGKLGAWAGRLADQFPGIFALGLLGVGSPMVDHCHLLLADRLSADKRVEALATLIETVEAEARKRKAALIAFKDVAPPEEALIGGLLAGKGFARLTSLPVAVAEVCENEDAYLARLSAATRKDVKRKLKTRDAVRVERRTDITGLESEIAALYRSTQENSQLRYGDFEELPSRYFEEVSRRLGKDAVFQLYWIGDRLAAFNLLLVGVDRVVDKFLGMAYPLARDHNLYVVSWMENLSFCREIGRPLLQTGQTAYASKIRMGSRLEPSAIYVKHTNGLLNRGLAAIAPWLAFDRWDPDLREANAKARDRAKGPAKEDGQ
ncbi:MULTISPECIES: GNAT family N-acetyltransferase [Phyllobacteriaceae]|jgi:predicted N-acyltransferase|uniref:GNAT family N-acetyltransferase n=1 Tax=Mesorhizobium hungaricum TaxID=1566387 RepID=A0A1C2DFY7_9HYPH|nr:MULTISPECIES: GNAT family N-acetyltransferase [Mesorhizobium]MBN9236801.1 GNAT family N-acetyltransferase [Mesorhizobium sp.]MDQ0331092.1 putative N-acyltransferase [Mesorhizobium sp. YL-MeA3-2017]OCX13671.1 hypothetical protein QV13_22450 [Mesorhizobium hungaricum]